jgi:hypothetical protein
MSVKRSPAKYRTSLPRAGVRRRERRVMAHKLIMIDVVEKFLFIHLPLPSAAA